ncbi:carbohydrate sulfotransferase 5-like [Lissotriton helveticus]
MVRRITVCRLFLYLIAALLLLLWCMAWQRFRLYGRPDSPSRSRTRHLLILSTWRSGSTFVGQIFNQNPSVFYLSEPTRMVWSTMYNKSPTFLHKPMADLLRELFLCNLSALKPFLARSEFVSGVFGWSTSRALCSPPACDTLQGLTPQDGQECYHVCHLTPFERAEQACMSHSHIVVKAVRFLDLKVLFPLFEDPNLNLRIIHVVRDPRAIVVSRVITRGLEADDNIISNAQNSSANIFTVMKEICNAQVKIYEEALEDLPPSMKGRYVIVRYEDLVRDPMPYVQHWYDRLGLTVLPQLESWVYHNTQLSLQKIPELWRKKLKFQKVQVIQQVCQKQMDTFGYRLVNSKEEQADQSLETVLPRSPIQT